MYCNSQRSCLNFWQEIAKRLPRPSPSWFRYGHRYTRNCVTQLAAFVCNMMYIRIHLFALTSLNMIIYMSWTDQIWLALVFCVLIISLLLLSFLFSEIKIRYSMILFHRYGSSLRIMQRWPLSKRKRMSNNEDKPWGRKGPSLQPVLVSLWQQNQELFPCQKTLRWLNHHVKGRNEP